MPIRDQFKERVLTPKRLRTANIVLRVLGVIAALLMTISNIYCFYNCTISKCKESTNTSVNSITIKKGYIRDWVASFLTICLGLALAIAEAGHWLKKFPVTRPIILRALFFLKYRTARGVFYIIGGMLTLTRVTWMIVFGVFVVLVGLVNLIAVTPCLRGICKDSEASHKVPHERQIDEVDVTETNDPTQQTSTQL